MGILDAVKGRLGGGNRDEYDEDETYYEGDEYYEDEQQYTEDAYSSDEYFDDAADDAAAASNRRASVFDNYTPLVSMSDVRSQELPAYSDTPARGARQNASQQIRTSLPYIDESRQNQGQEQGGFNEDATGQLSRIEQEVTHTYTAADSSDPLLKRHSLSNTGDFSATSPAYYASRSGVGHVRPAGQARRSHKFREAVVVRPESYVEAEQVAVNIRRGNAVVLVLSQTRPELAKRILDFSFGAAAVAEGQVASIGERIYAITTEHPLTNTELELLQARGIL